MKEYKLYYLETCPYCKKVLRFLERNNIDVELKEVGTPENQDELMKIGGKDQVPMLTIDGQPLYESGEIIKYFKSLEA